MGDRLNAYLWTWNGEEWNVESVAHLTMPDRAARMRLRYEQGYRPVVLGSDDEEPPRRWREREARR